MMEIIWADHVRNEEVSHRIKEERNSLQTIKRRKINWIGHILLRNWLLEQITEGNIKGKKRGDNEKGDVGSYCMTLREREATGYWKRKR